MKDPLIPPRLRNDCFAMPQGVNWVPVDEALEKLRAALVPLVATETVSVTAALGRVLAEDAIAIRSHPPSANAAVDGYGFAQSATGSGVQRLPLIDGVAAAGRPYQGKVPEGSAIRILTGASLPKGVDTVVLEEDCAVNKAEVAFDGPIKKGANVREAGEDVAAGAVAIRAGRIIRATDLALLSALNVPFVRVHKELRVGVLSTGDELVSAPGNRLAAHQIVDANRPMLLGLIKGWGFVPVDLGNAPDDPDEIAQRLDDPNVDVILTSGGASAGDEDHISRLLNARGTVSSWRIAMKPGRPLVLANWDGKPVFGLPGNPVAAFVCAAIFARPALTCLAGAGWCEPLTMLVPAAFQKEKKPGRREYLRARLVDGAVEVFSSEGSGRVSGLTWADGLVELPDDGCTVSPGDLVRYLPFSGMNIA